MTTTAPGRAGTGGAADELAAAVPRGRLALALLVSAQFVVMLDTSVVNVALPSVQRDLALGPAGASWVVNAYLLAFGGLLLVGGRAADVVGRRRAFVLGSAVFLTGTLAAAAASTAGLLVAARAVQGVGAALLSPAAMSLLLVMFPGVSRARAMSAWGAASTLGGASGVLLGGALTGALGWPWVFLVTVPVSASALLLAPRVLDAGAGVGGRRFDVLGAATVTGAVVALVHTALAVPEHGWLSWRTATGAGAAGLLLAVFAAVERAAADPLVPPDLVASWRLRAGTVLAVLGGAARASTFVLVALYLQQALLLAPGAAGLAMVPTSLTGFVVSVLVLPRVLRRIGPERTMVLGLVVLAGGQVWIAAAPSPAAYGSDVLPGLLLVATGVALSFTPTTMVIAHAVPAGRAGVASGLASAATQVGASLGVAAFAAVAAASAGDEAAVATADGFAAAFVAAALTATATALVGCAVVVAGRSPRVP
ncbi:MFS transporter [Cellulomonas telluris]|uniref:MFS transporter n=1 Tax=Cellulomonas telluris TaxID=2306636 RepID=UPI0014562DE2|nr:MFS transporter [Cellulomonas telluris]